MYMEDFIMKFGYFDDTNKEYVITSPKTPLPWINYLGSENFFFPDLKHLRRLQFLQRCKVTPPDQIPL